MARTLTFLHYEVDFPRIQEPCDLWYSNIRGWKGIQMESVNTISHCNANGQNTDLPARRNSSSRFGGADNGYLGNHLSQGISDVTVVFPVPENVNFDILHAILSAFWSNFIMCYCVGGGHFGFKFCPRVAEFKDSVQQTRNYYPFL